MKNHLKTLLLSIIALLIVSGCRTAVTEKGEPCYAISPKTEDILIAFARKSLNPPTTVLSTEDFYNYIKNVHPVVNVIYTDDCYGTAEISWVTPSRKIKVIASGDFEDSDLRSLFWRVKASPIYDDSDTIDNTKEKSTTNPKAPATQKSKYW